jgi:catechol 2,3-dioxygenase-like lactoylglutathione lyase family enzyme
MTEQEIEETLASLWQGTYQVGVVVADLERAVSFYERVGIGPFTAGPSAEARNRRVHGSPAPDVKVEGRLAQMGPIEFELLQPVSGPSFQAEYLERHGEGVVHLCAYVDDIEKGKEALESRGFSVVSSGEFDDGGKFAYFGTAEVGGLVLELFEDPAHPVGSGS